MSESMDILDLSLSKDVPTENKQQGCPHTVRYPHPLHPQTAFHRVYPQHTPPIQPQYIPHNTPHTTHHLCDQSPPQIQPQYTPPIAHHTTNLVCDNHPPQIQPSGYNQPAPHYPTPVTVRGDLFHSSPSPPMCNLSPPSMSPTYPTSSQTRQSVRLFKMHAKDILAMTPSFDPNFGEDSSEEFEVFRQKMLALRKDVPLRNNKNMKRSISPQVSTTAGAGNEKTAAYWERRRKNNEAAKRSRDARRAREDELIILNYYYKQEIMKLKCELSNLKAAKHCSGCVNL